jgi:D-glycero-alpha-D-manno-heptose 1-phosphate guanylyltransferase
VTTPAPEAIVLAGGLGTRLKDVVADLPKALAPVDGRPFAAYLLDMLAAGGIRRVVLATGHLAELVEEALGRRWQGMDLCYSVEGFPLGTGGAIRKALAVTSGGPVIVLNGDTYLEFAPLDFAKAMAGQGADIGVGLAQVPDVARYGEVALRDGRVVGFGEKAGHGPGCINAGLYYLSRAESVTLPDKPEFSFEQEVLVPAAAAGRLHGYTRVARFVDIGVPEDYGRAQALARGWRTDR